jgi:TatD DNase family protein
MHETEYAKDLPQVLERARSAGMAACITVGTDRRATRAAVALARGYEDVFATLAVHPHDAKDWDAATGDEFRALAAEPKVVAIGEIGLDFYRNLSPRDTQYGAFEDQLALADETRLPVVIHSRNAGEETFGVLEAWSRRADRPHPIGVIHCFSGDLALALRYADLGFMISFAGPVTYPRTDDLKEAARLLPLESITVETDAPFLTPQSRRGKRNEPLYVIETIETIASLRGLTAESVAEATADNAERLFRIGGYTTAAG